MSCWISTRELVARGIPGSAIDRAVADGKLKGTALTGGDMSFGVDAVDAWLGGCPDGVRAPGGIAASLRYDREQKTATSTPTDPIARVDSLIAHLTGQGYSRADAAAEVFRTDPGLRARYVAAIQQREQRRDDYGELAAMRGREARHYQK